MMTDVLCAFMILLVLHLTLCVFTTTTTADDIGNFTAADGSWMFVFALSTRLL